MAKKSKSTLTVYGSLPGEVPYETMDHKIFVVDTSVRSIQAERKLLDKFVRNPQCSTRRIQVIPVDEKTHKPVDYYSEATPRPGHVFLIAKPNDAVLFNAIVRYNTSRGSITNKMMVIRYEIINLKGHKEKLFEFAARDANHSTKKTDYVCSVKYYNRPGLVGVDNSTCACYAGYENLAIYSATKLNISGKGTYQNGDIKAVIIGQGDWTRGFCNNFKNGILKTFNTNLALETKDVIDFFADLITVSGGILHMRYQILTEFMKFYYEATHVNGMTVDLGRILKFVGNYPAKAHGHFCSNCGQLVAGYIDRFNNIGIDRSESISNIINDMTREPGF